MRALLITSLLLLIACDAPDGALVQRCSSELMSQGGHCELSATKLTKNQTAFIDARSKNFRTHVEAAFSVTRGKATVVLKGCDGDNRVDVTPGVPAKLSCDSSVNRNSFTFPVDAWVGFEGAEGFRGSVDFKPL